MQTHRRVDQFHDPSGYRIFGYAALDLHSVAQGDGEDDALPLRVSLSVLL